MTAEEIRPSFLSIFGADNGDGFVFLCQSIRHENSSHDGQFKVARALV